MRHALSILLAIIMGLALILAAALAASIAASPPARADSAEIDILVVLVDWTTQEKIQIACTTEGNAYACARLNNNDMTAEALNAIPAAAGPSAPGDRSPLRAEIHANSIVIRSDADGE